MSKLANQYNELKKKDNTKVYLFRSGIFYIALNEDAKILNEKIGLQISEFGINNTKCGFPVNSVEKFTKKMDDCKIKYELINNLPEKTSIKDFRDNVNIQKIVNKIKGLDMDNVTPKQAYDILLGFKGIVDEQ